MPCTLSGESVALRDKQHCELENRDTQAMASRNLELVQSIQAAWERGDLRSVGWADPEIEFVFVDGPAPGTWRGIAGLADAFRDFLSAWEGFRIMVDEYRELDDERVLALTRGGGRGKASGVELGQTQATAAHLFHVRGGKVFKLVVYFDRENALADLGLASEAGYSS
jgi:ketosteroid isomerase-like protein